VKLTIGEGVSILITITPGNFEIPSLKFLAAVKISLAFYKYPFLPCFIKAAHVPTTIDPFLLPAMAGVAYIPPGQSVTENNICLLKALVLNISIEHPFGP
jgi:hypothetical protein